MSLPDADYYLDEMPGETRGIVVRDGEYHALLIQRDGDRAEFRFGSRLVGRVARIEPGLKAAFIDLGFAELFGFLSLNKSLQLAVGAKIEVIVTAEPRDKKGPALSYVGPASGDVRLLKAGPTIRDIMHDLSGGELLTGLEAIRASLEAQEAATSISVVRQDAGLDLSIERTRALISVDIDYAPLPGKDSKRGRDKVNRVGLIEAARMVALKGLGGLVVVDLAGVNLHVETVSQIAKAAFGHFDKVSFTPVSKFGLLQLSLPWTRRPVEEVLSDDVSRPLHALRCLNQAIHEDRTQPVWILECDPRWHDFLTPLVTALGPRARLQPTAGQGAFVIKKG